MAMSVGTNLMMSTEMERHSLPLPHIRPLIGDPGMTREQMNDVLTCVLQSMPERMPQLLSGWAMTRSFTSCLRDIPAMTSSGTVSQLNPFSLKWPLSGYFSTVTKREKQECNDHASFYVQSKSKSILSKTGT